MEKNGKKIQHDGGNQIFFRRMTVTIFLYIVAYSILFFFLGARLTALLFLIGVLVFNPAIIILERLNFPSAARMTLVLSGLYYIYTTHVGIRADMNADDYT